MRNSIDLNGCSSQQCLQKHKSQIIDRPSSVHSCRAHDYILRSSCVWDRTKNFVFSVHFLCNFYFHFIYIYISSFLKLRGRCTLIFKSITDCWAFLVNGHQDGLLGNINFTLFEANTSAIGRYAHPNWTYRLPPTIFTLAILQSTTTHK